MPGFMTMAVLKPSETNARRGPLSALRARMHLYALQSSSVLLVGLIRALRQFWLIRPRSSSTIISPPQREERVVSAEGGYIIELRIKGRVLPPSLRTCGTNIVEIAEMPDFSMPNFPCGHVKMVIISHGGGVKPKRDTTNMRCDLIPDGTRS